jgi:hypothetical protein
MKMHGQFDYRSGSPAITSRQTLAIEQSQKSGGGQSAMKLPISPKDVENKMLSHAARQLGKFVIGTTSLGHRREVIAKMFGYADSHDYQNQKGWFQRLSEEEKIEFLANTASNLSTLLSIPLTQSQEIVAQLGLHHFTAMKPLRPEDVDLQWDQYVSPVKPKKSRPSKGELRGESQAYARAPEETRSAPLPSQATITIKRRRHFSLTPPISPLYENETE